VTVDQIAGGFEITSMKLKVRATVPGADAASFKKAAEAAKNGCPVSKALTGIKTVELDAALA
jgi:osmotically inducible protein OsmC